MIKKWGQLALFTIVLFGNAAAQEEDSVRTLGGVQVRAYEGRSRLNNLPAAVNLIRPQVLQRFSPASVVQAINTTPGVRMEERSPGSYRLNIRGSSLRSPFGVRNVKIYYNDIPITDPTGFTYLNALGYYNFGQMEVIKGPGSSLYGGGTGGVMLIQSVPDNDAGAFVGEYTAGSYGLQGIYAGLHTNANNFKGRTSFQQLKSDGYRDHSAMERTVLSWSGTLQGEGQSLKASFLYSDLQYQTPGALTATEYEQNRRASRPAVGALPSAVGAGARIDQKTAVAGLTYQRDWTARLQSKTTAYGMFTSLNNPAIQNWGRNKEPHVGGRTAWTYTLPIENGSAVFTAGTEWQKGFYNLQVYRNRGGVIDSLRTTDEVTPEQSILFAQANINIKTWVITTGLSRNNYRIGYQRFSPRTTGPGERKIENVLMPRFALLKSLKNVSVYGSVAKGFSPPTTAELFPTGGAANPDLEPEQGWNTDIGFRATLLRKIFLDVNAFLFRLENSITQQRNVAGGDFYINSGAVRQQGIEAAAWYDLLPARSPFGTVQLWASHTLHRFRYKDYKPLNNNFSGNKQPGIPLNSGSVGIDASLRNGLFGFINCNYSSRVPLNDANTAFANRFAVTNAQAGYQRRWGRAAVRLAAGVDNIFNERYSLGNDINGFGGRFFNAAAGRTAYATVRLQWLDKVKE